MESTGWLTSSPIYRPPDFNILEFWNEFTNLLESNINSSGELVLLWDFNIAINKPFNVEPSTFLDSFDSFNLVNKVDKPTHRLSNTLYLIIHDEDSKIFPRTKVDRLFSYHNSVLFDIATPHTTTTSRVQTLGKYKEINSHAFMKDVWKFCLDKPPGPSLGDKINHYNTMLQTILENHAPIKSLKYLNCPKVPWFSGDIAEAIRLRRHLERNWYRDRSNVDAFTLFHHQCWLASNLLDKAEWEFFLTSITENSSNYKYIHDKYNHLLGRTKESPFASWLYQQRASWQI